MSQFRPEIIKMRVCTFQMFGKITDSAREASEQMISTPSHLFSRYLAALAGRYLKNDGFTSFGAGYLSEGIQSCNGGCSICKT